eukprot:GFUD01022313.1.p1 GENE.GFUD01022313.1~~GFUD01022313.1.p1  ORF type:complete len:268 (-),score=58.35 GFUD01022313.1:455-1174(-)
MLFYLVFFILVIIAFFDLYWILRLVCSRILAHILPSLTLDQESVTYNLCWTTDIDYFAHMNNGKYFREMDFGRFDYYFRTGLSAYIESRPNDMEMYVVQHAASIRYRRSINLLVPFKLVTRLVFWDERSLYFEQKFVSLHDGFIRAIALCKNTVVGGSVKDMMSSFGLTIPPPCPEEVVLWLRSQEVSSNRLKMEGHGKSVGNNLAAMNEGEKPKNENEDFERFSGLNTTPDSIKSKGL